MNYGRVLHRRLLKLERNRPSSTEEKMEKIQQAALAATSSPDLRLLRDFELLKLEGREQDATEEQRLAQNRFDAAYENALIAAGPGFSTIRNGSTSRGGVAQTPTDISLGNRYVPFPIHRIPKRRSQSIDYASSFLSRSLSIGITSASSIGTTALPTIAQLHRSESAGYQSSGTSLSGGCFEPFASAARMGITRPVFMVDNLPLCAGRKVAMKRRTPPPTPEFTWNPGGFDQ